MRNLLIAAALVPCACATTPIQGPPAGLPAPVCSNEALGSFIGQPASSDIGARMLAASGARVIRWVGVGMAVTMDYRVDRLTVRLDAGNRIISASCG